MSAQFKFLVEAVEDGQRRRYVRSRAGHLIPIRPSTVVGSPAFLRDYRAAWNSSRESPSAEIGFGTESALLACLRRARARRSKRAGTFDLDYAYVVRLLREQNGRCAVSGVPFDLAYSGDSRVNPYQPSLDRIDPRKGYLRGNVRLTLYAVNIALNDMPMSDYVDVCRAVAEHQANLANSSRTVEKHHEQTS